MERPAFLLSRAIHEELAGFMQVPQRASTAVYLDQYCREARNTQHKLQAIERTLCIRQNDYYSRELVQYACL